MSDRETVGLLIVVTVLALLLRMALASVPKGDASGASPAAPQAGTMVSVQGDPAAVRDDPADTANRVGTAGTGQRLEAVGQRPGWLAVRWPVGSQSLGWIARGSAAAGDLAAVPFLEGPSDCQAIAGDWTGQVGNNRATLEVRWDEHRCHGDFIYDNVDETVDIHFPAQGTVSMQGTAYRSLRNARSFSLDTFQGRIQKQVVLTMTGTYDDAAGHRGGWSMGRSEAHGIGQPGNHRGRFRSPTTDGVALDRCRSAAKECGQPAADAYCRTQGYDHASNWHIREFYPTKTLVGGFVCTRSFGRCDRFTDISCAGGKQP
jgi:hypothetical protein